MSDTALESREAWARVAAGWEVRRAFVWEASRGLAERLVELLDPRPGETVLELAAGLGESGFLAAPRLEPGGRLLSTDVVPEMVEAARRRGAQLTVANVEHRVLDAQATGLATGSIDGVLCRWGYMLCADPLAALVETHRVLRAHGRLACAVWAEAKENPWGTAVGRALVDLGFMERPDPDAPGPFRLGEPERLRRLVTDAGFEEPQTEDVPITFRYASFDEYWAITRDLSFTLASALDRLTAEDAARVRGAVERALEPFADAAGRLALPGLSKAILARA